MTERDNTAGGVYTPSDVYLGVPNAGTLRAACVERLYEALADHRSVKVDFRQGSTLTVAQSRNLLVKRFLETDRRVLVMVDSDIVVPPHFLKSLTSCLAADPEVGLVNIPHVLPVRDGSGLTYGIFRRVFLGDEGDWSVREYESIPPVGGMHEIDACASGCVAIRREVFDDLGNTPFHIPDDPHAQITTEDLLFCEDLQDVGWRVAYWWDGWFCDHHSTVGLGRLISGSNAIMMYANKLDSAPTTEVRPQTVEAEEVEAV